VTEKQFAGMVYLHGARNDSLANSDNRIIFLGEDFRDES
jgi:CRISPR-associated protein Cas2